MKHMWPVITGNPTETKKFAKNFAKKVLRKKPAKKALIIGLAGELGSGKTTFVQGFADGFGIKEKILSPTFVILKRFKINNKQQTTNSRQFNNFYHIDCYRIQSPKEILDLGWQGVVSDPQNIIIIEWAEKIKEILPKSCIILKLQSINKNMRKIKVVRHCSAALQRGILDTLINKS